MPKTAEKPLSMDNEAVADRIQQRLGRARGLAQHLEDQLNASQIANAALLASLAELIGEDLDLAHDELDFIG